MSYTPEEKNEIRYQAALELLRFKALVEMQRGGECVLTEDDINECLIVAGYPVITPGELKKKELEVI